LLPKQGDDNIEIPDSTFFTDKGRKNAADAALFLRKAVGSAWGYLDTEYVQLPEGQYRANCSGNKINIRPDEPTAVVVHEFGHRIEHAYGDTLGMLSKAFAMQELIDHKEQPKYLGGGYDADEIGAKDGFVDAYVGKFYPHRSSEVLSMGVQKMYEDPMGFFKASPRHFEYTLAALHGWLTRPEGK
jgi:hypothetical protein